MMTNSFGNKKFHASIEKAQHALIMGPVFSFLRLGGMREVFFLVFLPFSQCVLNVFSTFFHQILKGFSSSQSVPKWVRQDVPNSTSTLSLMVCPEFYSHVYKLEMYAKWEHICFYFATRVQKGAPTGGMDNVPKTLLIGQSTWLLHWNKKKSVSDPWAN